MTISFYKYHGAGNDFILIDNRAENFSCLSEKAIAFLCDRHLGIGADGLMFLEEPIGNADFSMRYFNSDGRESTMCGNGGRCITAFAKKILEQKKEYVFSAIDGLHTAEIISGSEDVSTIRLKMVEVKNVEKRGDDYFLNTGSPHFVRFVNNVETIDIIAEAQAIRYNEPYLSESGTNVNFVQQIANELLIRTYERGVENETLACGTGAVAAAIAAQYRKNELAENVIYTSQLTTRGGILTVEFCYKNNEFSDIFLTGQTAFVFEGKIILPSSAN